MLAVAVGLMVAACSESEDRDTEHQSGGTLVVAQLAEPRPSLDPALSANVVTYTVTRPVLETLVTLERGGPGITPQLATSWEVSPDGRSWTFQLRRNVRFHDGTLLDAAAVCANFERWYHFSGVLQQLASPWREVFGAFATGGPNESLYKSCESSADLEVVLNLTRPTGALLAALALPAFGIASPTSLRRDGADKVSGTADEPRFEGSYGSVRLPGTGPFELQRWDRNDKVVLVRNRSYWGTRPGPDRVIIRRIDDGGARRQALQSGEIDGYWPVGPAEVRPLAEAGMQVFELPALTLGYLGFNVARPPLDNPKIRQAVAHALDREKVVRAKYAASATVADEIVPPHFWGHAPDVPVYAHDPQRARQLITESGVPEPTLELWYPVGLPEGPPTLPDPEGIALAFEADLEEAGFTVTALPTPWFSEYMEALLSGRVHMFLNEIVAFRMDPDAVFDQFTQQYETGAMRAPDGELLALLDSAAREIDQGHRAPLYEDANRMVAERVLMVPFVHVKPAIVYSPKIRGYGPSPIVWEGLFDVRLT